MESTLHSSIFIVMYSFRRQGEQPETHPPDIVQDSTSATTLQELEKLF